MKRNDFFFIGSPPLLTSFQSSSFTFSTTFRRERYVCAVCSPSRPSLSRHLLTACQGNPKKRTRRPNGYWKDIKNLKAELLQLHGDDADTIDVLPTAKQLRELGRRDIDNAISNMGGYHNVAEMLGCRTASRKKPKGYWASFDNLELEINALLNSNNPKSIELGIKSGRMPTQSQLRSLGRADILTGIEQHGGIPKVAKRLGLGMKVEKKTKYYWKDWSKVSADIRQFVAERTEREAADNHKDEQGLVSTHIPRMPSQRELRAAGRADLAEAISDFHGGFREVALKLGFVPSKKDNFYYDHFYNVAREVYIFTKELEMESVMPTIAVMKDRGRTDIGAAIVKYGGMAKVAKRLGMQYRVRTSEPFKDWNVFRGNLRAFMERHGSVDEIPSSRLLTNFGREELYQAILHHGGSQNVADRMGLKRNYWQDFHRVAIEVLGFIEVHGTQGVMPTEGEFVLVGRTALNVAVSKFGHSQVATRLGLTQPSQSTNLAFDSLLSEISLSGDDATDESQCNGGGTW